LNPCLNQIRNFIINNHTKQKSMHINHFIFARINYANFIRIIISFLFKVSIEFNSKNKHLESDKRTRLFKISASNP